MSQKSIIYSIYKIFFIVGVFLGGITNSQAQSKLYIMSYGGPLSGEECYCTYFHFKVESNGVPIYPISIFQGTFIYDKRPTFYDIVMYRPDSEMCSGYCNDGLNEHYGGNINADCTATKYDAISLFSNQVLVDPGADNTFCDKINLKATGCTTPERFRWEYRIDGGSFQPTNINTGFNETFQFVKSAYLPESYVGNIDFRVLIDSNTSITGEEVYSNIVSYYVNPCPPVLNSVSSNNLTSCVYKSDGEVTLNFDRGLQDNEQYEMALKHADGSGLTNKIITKSMMASSPKSYTWTGLGIQSYILTYQTRLTTANGTSLSQALNKTFTVGPPSQFSYQIITTQPACHNQSGIIKISASNGTSPYFYSIDSATEVEFLSITDEITLPAGNHYITVRDSKNCIDINANDQKI